MKYGRDDEIQCADQQWWIYTHEWILGWRIDRAISPLSANHSAKLTNDRVKKVHCHESQWVGVQTLQVADQVNGFRIVSTPPHDNHHWPAGFLGKQHAFATGAMSAGHALVFQTRPRFPIGADLNVLGRTIE